MKKSLLIFIFFCFSFDAFSQSVYVKAGLNLSNIFQFGNSFTNDFKIKPGFHLGGTFEIPIDTNFYFETGLFIDSKGYKFESWTQSDPNVRVKTELYFIEIPLLFKYKYPLKNVLIVGSFGPNFGIGIWGYQTQKGSLFVPDKINYDCFGETGMYNRFYGALFGSLGIEYRKYIFSVNCNFGLTNIYGYRYAPYYSNYSISLSVGYKLWTK